MDNLFINCHTKKTKKTIINTRITQIKLQGRKKICIHNYNNNNNGN